MTIQRGLGAAAAVAALALVVPIAAARTRADASPSVANGKIAFAGGAAGSRDIFVVNPDGTGSTALTRDPADDGWPVWSPDGSRLAFRSQRTPAGIYVMGANGSVPRRIADPGMFLAWSGDGHKLAFNADASPGDISVVDSDGSGLVDVLPGPTFDYFPAWSPDGSKIAFERASGPSGLFVMNADGTNSIQLTSPPSGSVDQAPDISPDGKKIVFDRAASGTSTANLYVVNADGTGQHALATEGVSYVAPKWSPDGTKLLAHATNADGSYDLVVMNPDGTAASTIVRSATDEPASWQHIVAAAPGTTPSPLPPTGQSPPTTRAPSRQVAAKAGVPPALTAGTGVATPNDTGATVETATTTQGMNGEQGLGVAAGRPPPASTRSPTPVKRPRPASAIAGVSAMGLLIASAGSLLIWHRTSRGNALGVNRKRPDGR